MNRQSLDIEEPPYPICFDTLRVANYERTIRKAMHHEIAKVNRRVYWLEADPVVIVCSPTKPLWLYELFPRLIKKPFKRWLRTHYAAHFNQNGEKAFVDYLGDGDCFIIFDLPSDRKCYRTQAKRLVPDGGKHIKF